MSSDRLGLALDRLRQATVDTQYNGKLWLVGGYVRDKLLNVPSSSDDVDIVLEPDSGKLAEVLATLGLAQHKPVIYPRFGTAMVTIDGVNFELVTARRESYAAGSRKPAHVEPASIAEDARRRDFTINTLLENLHTGELLDPLGTGRSDISSGIIRTPLPPEETFADDPLRMLRAVRFASRFNFVIDENTFSAIQDNVSLLLPTVSYERIRDELNKIVLSSNPSAGLELLRKSGLLDILAPELAAMVGVTQNEFHHLPVWDHTLLALTNLVSREAQTPLQLRLAILLHDCGKPGTKERGQDGRIHFYAHQQVGAKIASGFLTRLKYSGDEIRTVSELVALHMRIGEYQPATWTDAAVRRFIRTAGPLLNWLFAIHRADVSALSDEHQDMSRANQLRQRITTLQSEQDAHEMDSPLSGSEIMRITGLAPGPEIGVLKSALTDAVIDGRLLQSDKRAAAELVLELHRRSV